MAVHALYEITCKFRANLMHILCNILKDSTLHVLSFSYYEKYNVITVVFVVLFCVEC